MRYIDNGTGDLREEALCRWLGNVLTEDVVGIRWQSGYFEASVLGLFMPTLQRLAEEELESVAVIGSNDGETQSAAVHQLVNVMGLPRRNGFLGVVRYSNGLFHPKTIHMSYGNGREVAYVGSSNLTTRGINGLNVEAGIVLDTEEGDSVGELARIGDAAREWFAEDAEGLFVVENRGDVDRLEEQGILTAQRVPRRTIGDRREGGRDPLPSRGRPHALPRMEELHIEGGDEVEVEATREPELEGDVLIAELAGPGRWGQAAFPQWFINNFFLVLPDTEDVLRLFPVTEDDGVGEMEEQRCGFKAGSRNWYYELGLAAEIGAYRQEGGKPIGIFHRVANQTCRYTILMPDDESYLSVAEFLEENRNRLNRPRNELPRTIVQETELRDNWPENWFFREQ